MSGITFLQKTNIMECEVNGREIRIDATDPQNLVIAVTDGFGDTTLSSVAGFEDKFPELANGLRQEILSSAGALGIRAFSFATLDQSDFNDVLEYITDVFMDSYPQDLEAPITEMSLNTPKP